MPSLRRAEIGWMLITMQTSIILLAETVALLPLVFSQVILSSSNFRVDTIACPGDDIIFYCSVNGSQTLSWSSNEYIGSNGAQLEFSTGDPIGTVMNSGVDSRVFANLTNVSNGNFLQSTLHLTSDQNSTVFCLTIIAGSRKSINFTVLRQDPPEMPQNAAAVEIPSTADKCVLLVTWNPPDNVDERTIRYIVRTSRAIELPPINETSTLASFLSPCEDIEGITINVTAIDVCGNIGGTTDNFEPSIPNVVTANPSNATTSMATVGPLPPNSLLSNTIIPAIIGGVLVSVAVAAIIAIVTSISICWYVRRRFQKIHTKHDLSEKNPLKKEQDKLLHSTALSAPDNPEMEGQVANVDVRQRQ